MVVFATSASMPTGGDLDDTSAWSPDEREPTLLVFRCCNLDEVPESDPAKVAAREGRCDTWEYWEPLGDASETLQLPTRAAEPLARIVVQPGEAEGLMGAEAEKGERQSAEEDAAAGLLGREPPQSLVEKKG